MCMSILSVRISMHHMCAWYPQSSGEGTGSPGAGILEMDSCEPPCGCWELNPAPLPEQVLLNAVPSLQSLFIFVNYYCKIIILFY